MNLIQWITNWFEKDIKGEKMNLNKLARDITLKEGGKKNLNIGDVKEVMKLVFEALAEMECIDILKLVNRYRK